jgi:hypothetical protein
VPKSYVICTFPILLILKVTSVLEIELPSSLNFISRFAKVDTVGLLFGYVTSIKFVAVASGILGFIIYLIFGVNYLKIAKKNEY